jgi:hypothetical protein
VPHAPPLHVSTPLPEHCVAPAVHEAVHCPFVHTGVPPEHAEPLFCQVPVESHVCGCCPLHWVELGEHTPVHVAVAALHAYGHVAPVFCQVPVASHVCGCSPLHCVAPWAHPPTHAPPEHVCPVHVAPGVVETRSGPHFATVVLSLQTFWPGLALAHSGSIGMHRPWLAPGVLSQFCPESHVWLMAQTPALQTSVSFCALPLHASSPGEVHGHPRSPTAPVPALTEHGLPSPPPGPSPAASPTVASAWASPCASPDPVSPDASTTVASASPPPCAVSALASAAPAASAPVMSVTPRRSVHALAHSATTPAATTLHRPARTIENQGRSYAPTVARSIVSRARRACER